jgi:hypothetical protein
VGTSRLASNTVVQRPQSGTCLFRDETSYRLATFYPSGGAAEYVRTLTSGSMAPRASRWVGPWEWSLRPFSIKSGQPLWNSNQPSFHLFLQHLDPTPCPPRLLTLSLSMPCKLSPFVSTFRFSYPSAACSIWMVLWYVFHLIKFHIFYHASQINSIAGIEGAWESFADTYPGLNVPEVLARNRYTRFIVSAVLILQYRRPWCPNCR